MAQILQAESMLTLVSSEVTKQNLDKQNTQYVWGSQYVGPFVFLKATGSREEGNSETPSLANCLGVCPCFWSIFRVV